MHNFDHFFISLNCDEEREIKQKMKLCTWLFRYLSISRSEGTARTHDTERERDDDGTMSTHKNKNTTKSLLEKSKVIDVPVMHDVHVARVPASPLPHTTFIKSKANERKERKKTQQN